MRLVAVESAARRACDVVSDGVACSVITTAPPHRSSGAQTERMVWRELCSGAPIADPVPRRLVSAFERLQDSSFRLVRQRTRRGQQFAPSPRPRIRHRGRIRNPVQRAGTLRFYHREFEYFTSRDRHKPVIFGVGWVLSRGVWGADGVVWHGRQHGTSRHRKSCSAPAWSAHLPHLALSGVGVRAVNPRFKFSRGAGHDSDERVRELTGP